jgi:hypothetical protein
LIKKIKEFLTGDLKLMGHAPTIELKECDLLLYLKRESGINMDRVIQHVNFKKMSVVVNDGIDRPLQEKGTGIQSAIIISLF